MKEMQSNDLLPIRAQAITEIEAQYGEFSRIDEIILEITDQNIRAFSATTKKSGIDFALKKDTSGGLHFYLIIFKDRDADVITVDSREFSAKNLKQTPSLHHSCQQSRKNVS